MLLVILSTNVIHAQLACPESFGNQGSNTQIHFKIPAGTCNDYGSILLVTLDSYNQVFEKTGCNGTNLFYTTNDSNLPNDTLTFNVRFVADGVSCRYTNGVLESLSYEEAIFNEQVSVYPNPIKSGDDIRIKFAYNLTAKISLYNISGKLILHDEIDNLKTKTLDTSNLTNGIYMLEIVSGNLSATRKVLVMK